MSDELCDKKEWKDYEWKNDHIILFIMVSDDPREFTLEFLVNIFDLDKICLSLQQEEIREVF